MKQQSFCAGWTFRKRGEEAICIELPHDATILEQRAPDAPSGSGGAFFPGGFYIYEKTFDAPPAWEAEDVILRFEGVYPKAAVYLNGEIAGTIHYGYTESLIPLQSLNYGGVNTIRVEADNEETPNSRWYAGAGIYRPVTLLTGPKNHILPDGIRVTTLSTDPAVIRVETACTEPSSAQVRIGIYERTEDGGPGRLAAQAIGTDVTLTIPNARLWDAAHPNLYLCRAALFRGREELDTGEAVFGIRSLRWSAEGFFVNGKNVLLKGGCIHHDNGILGARTYPEAEARRIRKLKEGGFNAIRSAHNPLCRYALEACDVLGMYVLDESWDMWYAHKNPHDYASRFSAHWEEDLTAMIRKDYNHPSVIMYSIGNEVTEPAKPEGVALAEKLVSTVKSLDCTRPVTAGLNPTLLFLATFESNPLEAAANGQHTNPAEAGSGGTGSETTDTGAGTADAGAENPDAGTESANANASMNSTVYNQMVAERGNSMTMAAALPAADAVASPVLALLDIQGYNYAASRYELEGREHPERILLGTETYPYDIAKNWEMAERLPYVIGDFMWTAWDYLGEVGIGGWTYNTEDNGFAKEYPWLLGDTGAYDILGDDNAEAGRAAVIWGARRTPYIGVQPVNHPGVVPYHAMWRDTNAIPRWSWKGCEGNTAVVEVYTKGAQAELYLNDRLIGRKETKETRASFETAYEPGVLRAVAYDASGVRIGESILQSADENTRITITPEGRAHIGKLLYVHIDITGENGIVECSQDTLLTLDVKGAELLGFGSANPMTQETFTGLSHHTYYGRSLAVLRIKEPQAVIQVTGKGLQCASLQITAES